MEMWKIATLKHKFKKKKKVVIFAIFHANVQIFSKVVIHRSITILHIVIIFGYLPHCQHKDICQLVDFWLTSNVKK
jgi:hypothetical protein